MRHSLTDKEVGKATVIMMVYGIEFIVWFGVASLHDTRFASRHLVQLVVVML
jgi:hypothetical protein